MEVTRPVTPVFSSVAYACGVTEKWFSGLPKSVEGKAWLRDQKGMETWPRECLQIRKDTFRSVPIEQQNGVTK